MVNTPRSKSFCNHIRNWNLDFDDPLMGFQSETAALAVMESLRGCHEMVPKDVKAVVLDWCEARGRILPENMEKRCTFRDLSRLLTEAQTQKVAFDAANIEHYLDVHGEMLVLSSRKTEVKDLGRLGVWLTRPVGVKSDWAKAGWIIEPSPQFGEAVCGFPGLAMTRAAADRLARTKSGAVQMT